jgi:hypothetical protein
LKLSLSLHDVYRSTVENRCDLGRTRRNLLRSLDKLSERARVWYMASWLAHIDLAILITFSAAETLT